MQKGRFQIRSQPLTGHFLNYEREGEVVSAAGGSVKYSHLLQKEKINNREGQSLQVHGSFTLVYLLAGTSFLFFPGTLNPCYHCQGCCVLILVRGPSPPRCQGLCSAKHVLRMLDQPQLARLYVIR